MATLDADLAVACPLVDATTLQEIIETDLDDAQLNNFLNFAWYRIQPLVGELGECGGAAALCGILKVLAAHFLTMFERQTKSDSVAGEWSVTYLGKGELGLNASLYGQQAIAMDCSGILAKAGMKRASFTVTDYATLNDLVNPTEPVR